MTHDLANTRFLRACRREPVDRTPVWLMRQAGRYMPEYRKIRDSHSLLTICKTPELATEVTLQPVQRFDLDAAIVFADILLPLEPMGLTFEFARGEGPVIENPIQAEAQVDRLVRFDPEEDLHFVAETIRLVTTNLDGRIPLIGFAGAPFTLASYMIEGGHSRNFVRTKQFLYEHPKGWHKLMEMITTVTASYLNMQVKAGASAVQVFDSWVGILSPEDYKKFVLPYSLSILDSLSAPSIHFSTGTAGYLDLIAAAGGHVIGVDWRIPLDAAWARFPDKAIQGNLDPASLLKTPGELKKDIRDVLQRAGGKNGHIFNLGHGVLPETPVEHVQLLIEEVHKFAMKEKS
jgi:uroporphyrinogen decarboxylase